MTRGRGIYDNEVGAEDPEPTDDRDASDVSDEDTPDVDKESGESTD